MMNGKRGQWSAVSLYRQAAEDAAFAQKELDMNLAKDP